MADEDPPSRPVLFVLVGLPGAGKTTLARRLEAEKGAFRLTADEWMLTLYGPNLSRLQRDRARAKVEALQWQVAAGVLCAGGNVVLDWGMWLRGERDEYRRKAEELGAVVKIIFLDVDLEELWSRISRRTNDGGTTLEVTRSELDLWCQLFQPPQPGELG